MKTIFNISIILICFLTCFCVQADDERTFNHVVNGSFEDGLSAGRPIAWQCRHGKLELSTNAQEGKYSLSCKDGYVVASQKFNTSSLAGAKMVFSFYIKGTAGVKYGVTLLLWNGKKYIPGKIVWGKNLNKDNFTLFSKNIKIPEYSKGKFILSVYNTSRSGTLWLDNVSLKLVGRLRNNKTDSTQKSKNKLGYYKIKYTYVPDDKIINLSDLDWYGLNSNFDHTKLAEIENSKWKRVEIGKNITAQGFRNEGFWYKAELTIPESWQGYPLVMCLGKISISDKLYFNNKFIAKTGFISNPTRKEKSKFSSETRKYLIDKKYIKYNKKNTILININPGALGGIYRGPYFVKPLKRKVFPTFFYRKNNNIDSDSFAHYVTDKQYLNNYFTNESIKVLFKCFLRSKKKESVACNYKVFNIKDNMLIKNGDVKLKNITPGKDGNDQLINLGKLPKGKYKIDICFYNNKGLNDLDRLFFCVKDSPDKIKISYDKNLLLTKFSKKKYSLDKYSHGHFGFLSKNKKIDYSSRKNPANGLFSFSTLVNYQNKGPLIFRVDLAPMPINALKAKDIYFKPWRKRSIWNFGYLSNGMDKNIVSYKVDSVNWINIKYTLGFSDKSKMEVYENAVYPGLLVNSSSSKINIFSGLNTCGLGQPQYMSYTNKQVIQTETGFHKINTMKKNWMLFWFNGAKGWNNFDYPFLVVFQKKPTSISQNGDSLAIEFKKSCGYLSIIPLYGINPISLQTTKNWKNKLPLKIIERCDLLAETAFALPVNCKENFHLDKKHDDVLIENVFEYLVVKDEWNSVVKKTAPVPCVYSLASLNNFPVKVSDKIYDFELNGLHGPYVGIPDSDRVVYKLKGIGKYINLLKYPDMSSFKSKEAQKYINIIKNHLAYLHDKKILDAEKIRMLHIQKENRAWANFSMGNYIEELCRGSLYVDNPQLKKNIQMTVHNIITKYFFDESYFEPIYDSIRDITIQIPRHNATENMQGIDMTHWMGKYFLGLWAYCYYFKDCSIFKDKITFLNQAVLNLLVSQDFELGIVWDSLFGLRCGSNMEDQGNSAAGLIAAARLYHLLGEKEMAEFLLYVSAKQLIGIMVNETVLDWVRGNRRVVNTTIHLNSINILENNFEKLGLEPNEHQGFYRFHIGQNCTPSKYHWYLPTLLFPNYALYPFAKDYFPEVVRYQILNHIHKEASLITPKNRIHPAFLCKSIEYRHHVMQEKPASIRKISKTIENNNNWWTVANMECLLEPEGKFILKKLIY